MTTTGTKVNGFVRVSTEDQTLDTEALRGVLERWCKANGAEVVAVCNVMGLGASAVLDGRTTILAAVSGRKERRVGGSRVPKRERMARDTVVSANVERLAEPWVGWP